MPEFLNLLPPAQALQTLLAKLDPPLQSETIETESALGRVTAAAAIAPHPLPSFPRSTVDGYALRAADSHGASDGLPAYLDLLGEVPMGAVPSFELAAGKCASIHTGGMLPQGADAVVMLEHTQSSRQVEVEVLRSVAAGENLIQVGEDVASGQEVLAAGVRLRPAEIGGLMALGITTIEVVKRPRVAILSSGDEVLPPQEEIAPGQVRDVNTYTLSALVAQSGGLPVSYGILPDRVEALRSAAAQARDECDLVVITAGSSASARDLTAAVINDLGQPGVLVHGVNVRPGKPTILGLCDGTPMIGLPGNPVSALLIAGIFVVPVIHSLLGIRQQGPQARTSARLSLNLSSQSGREDWVPVSLHKDGGGYLAKPVFGKSNLIFTLARADGLVRIPPEANGIAAGERVEVLLI